MRSLHYLIVLASCFAAGYASAADMPVKYAAPQVPPPVTWAGYYLGADVGYAFDAPIKFDTGLTTIKSVDPRGVFFGGFAGHNWQVGSLVVGLEIDAQGANGSKTATVAAVEATTVSLKTKVDFFGSARARVGLTTFGDSLLWYITGGIGFAHTTADIVAATTTVASAPTNHIMPVVGAGIDWRLFGSQNVFLRIEYQRYLDSKSTYAFGGITSGNVPAKLDLDTVRAGVAFKF